jgi:hypothetical protein
MNPSTPCYEGDELLNKSYACSLSICEIHAQYEKESEEVERISFF